MPLKKQPLYLQHMIIVPVVPKALANFCATKFYCDHKAQDALHTDHVSVPPAPLPHTPLMVVVAELQGCDVCIQVHRPSTRVTKFAMQ